MGALRVDRLLGAGAELGEGPVWRDTTAEVLWVDILRGEVHATDLDGRDRLLTSLDDPVGAVALTEAGEPIAATPDGLVRMDGSIVARLERDAPDVRMNDGKPDPRGRYVGGTMTLGDARACAGSLWSLDGETARRLVSGATISNGIAWAADGATMYWIDTPTGRVDAFDYDIFTGEVSERREWVTVDPRYGSPDGMCIDAAGGVWVALWGGGAVHRYLDQVLDEIITVPTPQVTCVAFVGPELDQLAITTAAIDLDLSARGCGDLYIAETGPIGLPPNRLGPWAS